MTKTYLKVAVLGVLSFTGLSTAYATPISGVVNTTGVASVNLTTITFFSSTFVGNLFAVSVPVSGSFTGLPGSTGTIANLSNNLTNTGLQPVGTPFSDPNWMVFTAASPLIAFDLTFINPGSDTTAGCSKVTPLAGDTCTPFAFSPFNLQNIGPVPGGTTITGTSVAFSVAGNARNVSTGELSTFTGSFTTQITGQNIEQILATINAGGSITNSYSANFIVTPPSTVPEPGTISLLGAGLIGLGLLQRRRARKA
jgi:hypothetical protein